MKRVVCLQGSPRPGGNSDQLSDRFCKAAEAAGAEVESHALRALRYQGCINLRHCKTGGQSCGQDDGLSPVLQAVRDADIVVLSTPVYFCNMSGLLKQAFDRFFSFLVPGYATAAEPSRLGRGKTLVLIQVQGEGPERYGDLLEQYGPALDKLGFERRELIRACGVREPGEVLGQTDVLERTDALAHELAGQGG